MDNYKDTTIRIGIDARLWNETGVGRYIRNLVSQLQKIDTINSYVLFIRSKDAEEVKLSIINDKWSVKSADIRWHTLREQLEFPKILEKENLDLVHFPYFSVPILYKGRFVLTIHDLILHHFPTGKASTLPGPFYLLKHLGYKFVIARAAKRAEKIITVSNATKKEIIKDLNIPKDKIEVTYEGIDSKITNLSARGGWASGPKYPYFLYVGNAYPHKNLERLIEGFLRFRGPVAPYPSRTTPNEIKLILVGKKDYFYVRLEGRVKKMGLEGSVLFMHNVSDEKLSYLYKNALAFVAPSLMEGFGLPVIESMENGCLVVLSDIPVFHEIAGEVPIYFSPTDIESIKNVLESVAKDRIENVKKRKEQGKEIAKKFSWEKMAKQTLEIYKSCVNLRQGK